jgi:hypothetical protein
MTDTERIAQLTALLCEWLERTWSVDGCICANPKCIHRRTREAINAADAAAQAERE